jgi:hypothetical protein
MELKKLYLSVDLVGYWHNSFDNSNLFTTAENILPKDSTDYDTAEAYAFIILDENMNITTEAIGVSFKQEGDDIILGYRSHKFIIVSANRYEVAFADGFSRYSLKRPAEHVLYKTI